MVPAYADEDSKLKYLLYLAKNAKEKPYAKEEIYYKGIAIFCTGNSKAATENNKAAELINQGNYDEAKNILSNALKHAALFFPFQYNIGICYLCRCFCSFLLAGMLQKGLATSWFQLRGQKLVSLAPLVRGILS